ncbi:Dabb family protein [Homoserinibacter sp. YIM 151385]|uniref:Dabb family protein n=1 Tax=Homoserinibacter sp. YIM 151385 TaxID=2985506 RepID=UPI0022F0CB4B|nr:Dabb family protein [Homoserinibacter sp. YIM 151385]WBU37023.1 Dabb family protein [Homoserinibacter sp. YIM 151385]
MIKHIVAWTLKTEDAAERQAQIADIAARLSPLVDLVEGLAWLEVHADLHETEGNSDVVLVSLFESRDALQAYQVHPEHEAAAAVIRGYAASRAAIDFESEH